MKFYVFIFLFACNMEIKKKYEVKKQERKISQRKKSVTKYDCKEALKWIEKNAVIVNPDTFPSDLYEIAWDYDKKYKAKIIDEEIYKCLTKNKIILVKHYQYHKKKNKFYEDTLSINDFGKLYAVYQDSKKQITGFTTVGHSGDGAVESYYFTVNQEENKIVDVAQLAWDFGDMGYIFDSKTRWLNDSTILRFVESSFADTTYYKASYKINIQSDGKISIFDHQIFIDLER